MLPQGERDIAQLTQMNIFAMRKYVADFSNYLSLFKFTTNSDLVDLAKLVFIARLGENFSP